MEKQMPKSKFKPRALAYFQEVKRTARSLIITDRGKPVLKTSGPGHHPVDEDAYQSMVSAMAFSNTACGRQPISVRILVVSKA